MLEMKERKALLVIRKASLRDSFWSEGEIKQKCRFVFYSLYDCVLKQNLEDVKPFNCQVL